MLLIDIEYNHVNQLIETKSPVKRRRITLFNDLQILLNSDHLFKYVVVMRRSRAVHNVLWIVNSIGEAKDTNLKYITPIIPHQREAPTVNNEPSISSVFINEICNKLIMEYIE